MCVCACGLVYTRVCVCGLVYTRVCVWFSVYTCVCVLLYSRLREDQFESTTDEVRTFWPVLT